MVVSLAVVVATLAAIALVGLGGEVIERGLPGIDRALRRLVGENKSQVLDVVLGGITWLGETAVLVPLTLLVALLLWRRKERVAVPTVLAPLAAALLSNSLKDVLRVGRPPSTEAAGLGYSFPSGHATAATAVWLTLTWVLAREGIVGRWAHVAGPIVVLLVGVSRVYLDAHWASDVAGGWIGGLAIAAACVAVYELSRVRWARKRTDG